MTDPLASLSGFNGIARLFPLPNLVFFPHSVQPLHIFEPRYRQMTADALAGDHLIALIMLRPGWEADYHAKPAIHAVACLGKVVKDQQLDDGRYNILLHGLSRAHIVEEISTGKLYRTARVELLDDTGAIPTPTDAAVRQHLRRALPAWFPGHEPVVEHFEKLLKGDLSLGILIDMLSFVLPLEAEFKQTLLEQPDVSERVRQLLPYLEANTPAAANATGIKFPPDFSAN